MDVCTNSLNLMYEYVFKAQTFKFPNLLSFQELGFIYGLQILSVRVSHCVNIYLPIYLFLALCVSKLVVYTLKACTCELAVAFLHLFNLLATVHHPHYAVLHILCAGCKFFYGVGEREKERGDLQEVPFSFQKFSSTPPLPPSEKNNGA